MIRSIRVTLTLWYIGILAGTLCLFGGVLYTQVASNLSRDVDQVLAAQADGVSDAIFAFWEAEHDAERAAHKGRAPASSQAIHRDIEEGHLPALVVRWAQETAEVEEGRPIRLVDRNGQSLYVSPSFAKMLLPMTRRAAEAARYGRTVFETFVLPNHRVRCITRPVVEDHRILYFVQTAVSLRQADASLKRLRLRLGGLIPATVVLTSVVGWFLATLALRPIGRLISQVRRIGAEDLHERVAVPATGDELERLAATFNEMLARLERAFRRLRQFSAAASHELRTPLTIMKGELEVALRKPRDAEEYRRVLGAHLEALNEMAQIVEELLTLARSEAGEGAVEWRPVELGELSGRVCRNFQKLADAKGVRLDLVWQGSLWVRGERHLLERLLANLLDNAIRHTPSQGSVTLEVKPGRASAYLIVRDTGPGISAEELPHIFDRFFRKGAVDEASPSRGLGLGLCRWIAEAHQGRIDAESLHGQGASFIVELPASSPSPESSVSFS